MKILNIVGARPNFMKMAPMMAAYREHSRINARLIHTGQHYDPNLSDVFFAETQLPPPDRNLGIGSGPRLEQIERVSAAFRPVMAEEKPDLVVVVGDVNSTLACATVAVEHGVPVAHVEAGLRSFDERMPEELNRVATDAISEFLFVTEPSGMENLKREKIPGQAFLVGNTMIDTLVRTRERIAESTVTDRMDLESGPYVVATFHRPSNVDDARDLRRLLDALAFMCERIDVVLPLHPRTRAALERHGLLDTARHIDRLHLTDPLGYVDFIRLVQQATCVVTDSGGIQEETTFLQVPCITMRDSTERPITVTEGTNVLVGTDINALRNRFEDTVAGRIKTGTVPALWDGHAATRIVEILAAAL